MSGVLKITMIKSMIGKPDKHIKVLKSLGLTKMNRPKEHADTPTIRGMINVVAHMVKTEEK